MKMLKVLVSIPLHQKYKRVTMPNIQQNKRQKNEYKKKAMWILWQNAIKWDQCFTHRANLCHFVCV